MLPKRPPVEALENLVLGQMYAEFSRRENPSTLYRPTFRVNGEAVGRVDSRKVNALLAMCSRGLVRLYYLDGHLLGAELTYGGIQRAQEMLK